MAIVALAVGAFGIGHRTANRDVMPRPQLIAQRLPVTLVSLHASSFASGVGGLEIQRQDRRQLDNPAATASRIDGRAHGMERRPNRTRHRRMNPRQSKRGKRNPRRRIVNPRSLHQPQATLLKQILLLPTPRRLTRRGHPLSQMKPDQADVVSDELPLCECQRFLRNHIVHGRSGLSEGDKRTDANNSSQRTEQGATGLMSILLDGSTGTNASNAATDREPEQIPNIYQIHWRVKLRYPWPNKLQFLCRVMDRQGVGPTRLPMNHTDDAIDTHSFVTGCLIDGWHDVVYNQACDFVMEFTRPCVVGSDESSAGFAST